jgi:geranylgeranyl diphosphate synthase type II
LNKTYPDLIKAIDEHLTAKSFSLTPKELYEPINYIMSSGGKRIRSILTLLGYYGYDLDYAKALPLAFSTELFHNFTLVHDDIMDEAPIRRGQPTVHTKYDENKAILSGDVMHAHVVNILSQLESASALRIIRRFSEVSILVCEGQSYDMTFEDQDEVRMEEYLQMIENKTAVLIGYALESGALLAGADKDKAHHLYQFGKNAGIAFQLQDDYLDLYGETFKVGKQKCGDIIQKKKNYFFVKAYELLLGDERNHFVNLYHSDSSENERVEEVLKIYDKLYLKNYLSESKNAFMDLAFSHLAASGYDDTRIENLKSMALSLAERDQ